MAKQHFYARVPAKMSLFQKMDGYDTFAHSEGVTRAQAENELSAVYANAPTKEDLTAIQNGALPTVYAQFATADGTLVQSAVSFMAADYTGERSAYMVHSLLLSEDERKACMETTDRAVFNAKLFQKDLSAFDLTASDAKPCTTYPELKIQTGKATKPETFVQTYDAGMLKRLIYALLGVACGKTKAVFLGLPSPLKTFSADCLEFLNGFLQIFPYHTRPLLSFVTYVGEFSKFPAFKIRCIAENAPAIPTAKGVTLKMGAKDFSGISDDNIGANAALVDFFFGLLTADDVRRDFLEFCRYAVEAVPALQKPTMKNLGDLVLLFRVLGGHFALQTVLQNDDAVYTYFTVYDKNRDALTEACRARSMECLKRYAEQHTVIPKNVFHKVSALYAEEPEKARQTAMEVALELIHTDVMREKLFGFIRDNYDKESAATKATIMQDLCRVYYGGFLQEPLLEFFTAHFADEPKAIRDEILERLLLTVRTPSVQGGVLTFVRTFYDTFSDAEKDKFYNTYREMLPEGDALSRALSDLVDDKAEQARQTELAKFILHAVENDDKHATPKLCAALATRCGFTERTLAEKVFTTWSKRPACDAFLEALKRKPLEERVQTVCEIWNAAPTLKEDVAERLLTALNESFAPNARADVFALISAVDTLDALAKEIPAASDFVTRWETETLKPTLLACVPTVFDIKRYPDGVAEITALAAKRTYLRKSKEFACVAEFNAAVAAARAENGGEMLTHLVAIEGQPVRLGAAEHLKRQLADAGLSEAMTAAFVLGTAWLKTGEWKFADVGAALRDTCAKRVREASPATDAKQAAGRTDEALLDVVLQSGHTAYTAAIPEEMKDALLAPSAELAKYVAAFVQKYERKGKKYLAACVDRMTTANPTYVEAVKNFAGVQVSSGGFFQKLFKH